MRARGWLVSALAILAVTLLVGRTITALAVDSAWFGVLGVAPLFWERLGNRVLLQGTAWLGGTLFAFANLHAVRSTIRTIVVPARVANLELPAMLPPRRLLVITIVAAVIIGFGLAVPLTDWTQVVMARRGIPFGEIEGILDRDLGFYVYRLPLEETAYVWALASLVVMVAIVGLLYALMRSLRVEGRRLVATTHVRRHLTVLGCCVLLVLAWSYRLDTFDLLRHGSGVDGVFLRMDHIVSLRVDRVLAWVAAVASVVLLRAGWVGQMRTALLAITLVLTGAVVGRQLLRVALARTGGVGDPARRDLPYVAARTLYSRRAYDVDQRVAESPRSAVSAPIALTQVPLRLAIADAESRRPSAPDAASGALVGSAGWAASARGTPMLVRVRRPTAEGAAWTVTISDLSDVGGRDSLVELPLDARDAFDLSSEPIIAPGLRAHRTVHEASGVLGVPLRSFWSRVAHAWALRDPALLPRDTVPGPAPRVVTHRDVRARLARLVPMLLQGEQVAPLLHADALLWTINLYAASAHYPLSHRWRVAGSDVSYLRFAGTALVDAATGRVRIVPADRLDPLARTVFSTVPSLVTPARELPPTLVDALPVPTESGRAQVLTFARYGARLGGSALRHVPDSLLEPQLLVPHTRSTTGGHVVAWSVPVVDGSERIDGVFTAVGGRVRHALWDTVASTVPTWTTITEALRTPLDSVRQLEGGRRDFRLRVATPRVLLVDRGIVAAQPVWSARADGTASTRAVALFHDGRASIAASVAAALGENRGRGRTGVVDDPTALDGGQREPQASRWYERMQDAMRRGDWTAFGAAFDSLGVVLRRSPR
jgi:hypothetical protein